MTTVNIHEAKTHLSQLVERARAGEEILIAKRGTPYARLCPLQSTEPRRPGLLEGEIGEAFFDPLPDDLLEAWEG